MISAQFEYKQVSGRTGAISMHFKVQPKTGPHVTDAVQIELRDAAAAETQASKATPVTKTLFDYSAWSESGYSLIARAIRIFVSEIGELTGNDAVEAFTLTIHGAPVNRPDTKEFSRVSFKRTDLGAQLRISGLLPGASYPLDKEKSSGSVVELAQRLCELCAVAPIDYDQFPHAPVVFFYTGGMLSEFVFVDEVPDAAYPWFVAYVNSFLPKAKYKNGMVALRESWEAFLIGRA